MKATHDKPLRWNSSLEIGVKEIDQQHRYLIALAERVLTITSPLEDLGTVVKSIRELQSYIETHFADEEELMIKYGYPLLEEHRLLHREIALDVVTMLKTTRDTSELTRKMKDIVMRWVVSHIHKEDRKIAQFLHNRKDSNSLP